MAPYFIVFTVLIETSINSAISLLSYPERTRRMMRAVCGESRCVRIGIQPGEGIQGNAAVRHRFAGVERDADHRLRGRYGSLESCFG